MAMDLLTLTVNTPRHVTESSLRVAKQLAEVVHPSCPAGCDSTLRSFALALLAHRERVGDCIPGLEADRSRIFDFVKLRQSLRLGQMPVGINAKCESDPTLICASDGSGHMSCHTSTEAGILADQDLCILSILHNGLPSDAMIITEIHKGDAMLNYYTSLQLRWCLCCSRTGYRVAFFSPASK